LDGSGHAGKNPFLTTKSAHKEFPLSCDILFIYVDNSLEFTNNDYIMYRSAPLFFLYSLSVLLALSWTVPSQACSIPVFRYALEHWAASPYTLIVLHNKPIPAHELEDLKRRINGANVKVEYVNLTGPIEPKLKKQIEKLGDDLPLPYALLKYPDHPEKAPPLYSGPLASPRLDHYFGSPSREKIFAALMRGESGVILLLEGNDPKQNHEVQEYLEREVPKIIPELPLPMPTEEGPQLISIMPLRKSFTIIRIPRTGEEEGLAQILLNCEEDLAKEKGPILFPVFGRGRVLTSLTGIDLMNKVSLKQALEYVCKACSCQVKELNPGVDLLMAGDWTLFLKLEWGPMPRVIHPATEPVKGIETRKSPSEPVTELRAPPPENLDVAVVRDGTNELPAHPKKWRPLYIGLAVIVIVLVLIWIRSRF
jgi:hypothetical protein